MRMVYGWHFSGNTLRNGQPLRTGHEYALPENEHVELCIRGYHSSKRMLDALQYAGGTIVSRTESAGQIVYATDEFVAEKRRHLWTLDVGDVLADFARRCALDVVHLWDAPEVVLSYLRTGNHELAARAREAAWEAVWKAAWEAAEAAMEAAGAAEAAAGEAAETAAWEAAEAAWEAAAGSVRMARAQQNRRLTAMVSHARKVAGLPGVGKKT